MTNIATDNASLPPVFSLSGTLKAKLNSAGFAGGIGVSDVKVTFA